jgi:uncharacterized protein (TIGR00299 family) protein
LEDLGMCNGAHLHLDPVGGIAGDMVCAALLDAFPQYLDGLRSTVAALGPPDGWGVELERVHAPLHGTRFHVRLPGRPDHRHRHWRDIRSLLEVRLTDAAVRARALAIFGRLAQAEARVHGVSVEEVEFHEVGDWDSIVDIVGAACLLERLDVRGASCGPLPLGGGVVHTAHGELPVPAPATLELLAGFTFHDDGIAGERVTPTGAAILSALPRVPAVGGVLRATGVGFGTRSLGARPNCLRVLCFERAGASIPGAAVEPLTELAFEIDDQAPEDLAAALERVRSSEGVLDVNLLSQVGKSGRLAQGVRVLLRPEALQPVVDHCLRETTTIGLRWHSVERLALARRQVEVEVEGRRLDVKVVGRPGGATAKVESRSLAEVADAAERARLRRLAEEEVLRGG